MKRASIKYDNLLYISQITWEYEPICNPKEYQKLNFLCFVYVVLPENCHY